MNKEMYTLAVYSFIYWICFTGTILVNHFIPFSPYRSRYFVLQVLLVNLVITYLSILAAEYITAKPDILQTLWDEICWKTGSAALVYMALPTREDDQGLLAWLEAATILIGVWAYAIVAAIMSSPQA